MRSPFAFTFPLMTHRESGGDCAVAGNAAIKTKAREILPSTARDDVVEGDRSCLAFRTSQEPQRSAYLRRAPACRGLAKGRAFDRRHSGKGQDTEMIGA